MELIGLYLIACALLVGAGLSKALRPGDTARALTDVLPGRLRLDRAVRVGAATEAVLGVLALALPRPVPAFLVAASYVLFAVYVAYVRLHGGVLASCGCFGKADTPANGLHVALNLVLGIGAAGIALQTSTAATLRTVLAQQPWDGIPLVLASTVGCVITYLALTALPNLAAVRRRLVS